jgi:hypothetical protein
VATREEVAVLESKYLTNVVKREVALNRHVWFEVDVPPDNIHNPDKDYFVATKMENIYAAYLNDGEWIRTATGHKILETITFYTEVENLIK